MLLTSDFSIEDLGIQEDWVYDLEVEETHNFFGNDILLHNSDFCDLSNFVKKIDPEGKADKHKITDAIDAFCKYDVEPFLESMFEKLCKKLGCRINTLSMKREAICDVMLYRAKKNYVMRVYDMEGVRYTEPRLKIAGIETERSDKPGICREKMKELLTVLMDGKEEDLQKEVRKFRKEYINAPLESITFPKGVNNLEKYSLDGKSIPIHVRASHVYNELLEQHPEILASYEKIKNGDKIRYVYLTEPNPAKSHVVGFLNKLPEEFGLTKYIDYDKMFEKAFLNPMQSMSKLIGWDCIHKPKLTSLFE